MFKRKKVQTNSPAKKKKIAPIVIAVIVVLGIIGSFGNNDTQAARTSPPESEISSKSIQNIGEKEDSEKIFSGLTITPHTVILEYSNKTVDPLSLVDVSSKDFEITVKNDINLSKLGYQTITYQAKKGKETKTFDVKFEIIDSKLPSIDLAETDIKIDIGSNFDLKEVIRQVSDSVDGDLPYLESPSSGTAGYWFSGSFDANTPGYYPITLSAVDRNGNISEKALSVTVNQPESVAYFPSERETSTSTYVEYESDPSTSVYSYVLNTNTMKFHYPGCRDVSRIKPANRQDVEETREDIISWGYLPCKHCNP